MFDPGHNYDDGPEYDENRQIMGITSLEDLQHLALRLFGQFIESISGVKLPENIPPEAEQYLPLDELERILRDHGHEFGGGFAIGADTRRGAEEKMRELLSALMTRVMSNVMQKGVNNGWLSCEFDTETNDFCFTVTDEGKRAHAKYKTAANNDDDQSGDNEV